MMNESGKTKSSKEEWSTTEHALAYLSKADNIPHQSEGEAVLLDDVPTDAKRSNQCCLEKFRSLITRKSHYPKCHFLLILRMNQSSFV